MAVIGLAILEDPLQGSIAIQGQGSKDLTMGQEKSEY